MVGSDILMVHGLSVDGLDVAVMCELLKRC